MDVLLPHRCFLCLQPGGGQNLCTACKADLPWLRNACDQCALPLSHSGQRCGRCLVRPPHFERCRAAFRYATPVDRLIGQFKNQRQLGAGKLLSDLLLETLHPLLPDSATPDLIAPVPLHWSRQLVRGFNQAEFLAEALARELELPLTRVAKRRRATPKQQQLSRRQRLNNLERAFVVKSKRVAGRRIALVDDVVTTGATAEALSRQLLKAGAAAVEIWTIARTPAPTL